MSKQAKKPQEKQKNIDFSKKVMAQIHEENISMKPKIFFILGSILLGSGLTFLVLLSIFFLNHFFYRLRMVGSFEFLQFGQHGWKAFWESFPMWSLLVALGAVGGGVILLKKYDVAYKRDFKKLSIFVIMGIILSGMLVDILGFNEKLSQQHFAQQGFMSQIYQKDIEGQSWLVGEVLSIDKDEKILTLSVNGSLSEKVQWNDETIFPYGDNFVVGQKVRVVGEKIDGVFLAEGIGGGRGGNGKGVGRNKSW